MDVDLQKMDRAPLEALASSGSSDLLAAGSARAEILRRDRQYAEKLAREQVATAQAAKWAAVAAGLALWGRSGNLLFAIVWRHREVAAPFIRPDPTRAPKSATPRVDHHIPGMNLDLSDADAHAKLLTRAIDGHHYPISPRVQTLRALLNKLRSEPVREPMPPLKHYGPPRGSRYRRRVMKSR
jgi:hypothetical protein